MGIGVVPERDPLVDEIESVVLLAIAPFEPGPIRIFITETRQNGVHIRVDVKSIPNHPFERVFTLGQLAVFKYMYQVVESITHELFNHYRYRPALPVEDHIQLGEN